MNSNCLGLRAAQDPGNKTAFSSLVAEISRFVIHIHTFHTIWLSRIHVVDVGALKAK